MFNQKFTRNEYEAQFGRGPNEESAFYAEIAAMGSEFTEMEVGQLGGFKLYPGDMFIQECLRDAHPDIAQEASINSLKMGELFLQTTPDMDEVDVEDVLKKVADGTLSVEKGKQMLTYQIQPDKPFLPLRNIPIRQPALAQIVESALGMTDEFQGKDEAKDPMVFIALYKALRDKVFRKNRTIKVWICGGKISAAGTSQYVVMPIDELFAKVVPAIKTTFPGLEFSSGTNSFAYTKAMYDIVGDEAQVLREKYEKMVGNRTTRVIPGMTFTVTVKTSNAKSSSASITPVITTDTGAVIPVGDAIVCNHKPQKKVGKNRKALNGIEYLVDQAPDVFAQFADPHSKFAELSDVVVEYPVGCLVNLCNKAGLKNKKLVSMCVDDLENILNGEPSCSMFDVYLSICQMAGFAESEGLPSQTIDDITEGIARILRYRWSESDHRADV